MTIYEKTCVGCKGTGQMVVANGSEDFDIEKCGCAEEVVTGPELLAMINEMRTDLADRFPIKSNLN